MKAYCVKVRDEHEKEYYYLKGVQEGTQKGIREVVKWIDSLPNWGGQNTVTGKFFVKGKLLPITDWQAFKKERGL